MNRYVVQQPFRGVATFLVHAETAREALEKVNRRGHAGDEGVECVDKDATWIGVAVWVRLDRTDAQPDGSGGS